MANKGGPFERQICKAFSLWFSNGQDDSWVWRSSGSGARATVRARKGQRTSGHTGDLTPTCAEAEPLFRVMRIECKRGHQANATLHDLLDRGPKQKKAKGYESFILQSVMASRAGGSPYWMLVHRRDQRVALCYFPVKLWVELGAPRARPMAVVNVSVRGVGKVNIVATHLEAFFEVVSPDKFRKIARNL